jgi:tetratricopeptide (TPR) repeat protein
MHALRFRTLARRTRALSIIGLWLIAGAAAGASAGAGAGTGADAVTGAAAPGAAVHAADARFWATLHEADYGAYPEALAAVEAAVAVAPEDPVQNAHLGWLHIWHLAEAGNFAAAGNVAAGPQAMSMDLESAHRYFKRAVELDPAEARYFGFYATTLVVRSASADDASASRRADRALARAVRMWPEFNLFTAGYIHSSDPYDGREYAVALARMWRNLDVCVGRRVSRRHPELAQYASLATTVGPKRACWNSTIAPHNLEGFFLNFGDMLVKNGDVAVARTMYANARLSSTYAEWPYRDVLERRIRAADANVAGFRDSMPAGSPEAQMMLRSNFACMGCHRR